MKNSTFCLSSLAIFLILAGGRPCMVSAQRPSAPSQVAASVVGHKVTLNWQNPDLGETLAATGFEAENAEPGDEVSLEVDGWTVKTTNTSDFSCTWFNYPTSEFMGADDYEILIHSGKRSAVVFLDVMDDGEHDLHQDEWLVSPVLKQAAYLSFSSFIDPRVVANGADPDYPDHYAVVVSRDGGKTWGEPIWDARYDATPEGGWQTVTLALAADPTDEMQVAFRAYGEYQLDEDGDTINQSLYATWAIDDVTITAARPGSVGGLLVSADFEDAEQAGDMSLEKDGWTVKTTVTIDPEEPSDRMATWFGNPVMADDEEDDMFASMVIDGKRSAMVLPNEMGYFQDEWLVSPAVKAEKGAVALQFSYKSNAIYIEEDVVVAEEGLGHYEVVVSKDGGKTWGEPVWTLANDKNGHMDETEMFYTNRVMLTVAAAPSDDVRIAFRAYGDAVKDEETGEKTGSLGGLWVIDDVAVRAADPDAAVVESYMIKLDGKDLAAGIQGTAYTDKSEKTPGKHTYAVYAVTAGGAVSEPATVEVTLADIVFAAPKNVVCTPTLDEKTGKYAVNIKWEAPDVDFQPVYYTIYSDKAVAGTELTLEDDLTITGLFGLYEFGVEAVYRTPDGVSERVTQRLALGVRFGATDLKAETEGKDVLLSWTAPQASEYAMGTYTVYRGGEKLAEGLKETTLRDAGVADGLYHYTVVAVYADGVESGRTTLAYQVGEEVRVPLPYTQTFNTTFCPENWRITNESDRTPDKYTWYFDDRSRLGVKGDGFDGCYAAIDCQDIGLYRLDAALMMPVIDLTTAVKKEDVTLAFNYSYAIGGIFKAGVEWSFDGVEWYLLDIISKENGFEPADDGDFHIQEARMRIGDEILPQDLAKAEKLYLRFHYEASRSHFWAIDNVYVGENAAVERPVEDMSVVVSASAGQLQVRAAQAIRRVEVYAVSGVKAAERVGNGLTELTMPAPFRGPAVVRVTTEQGVKFVKILL